jgi:hypothetical protein
MIDWRAICIRGDELWKVLQSLFAEWPESLSPGLAACRKGSRQKPDRSAAVDADLGPISADWVDIALFPPI